MSHLNNPLAPGDPIFHPKYGFGTIHGLTRRDRTHPLEEPAIADSAPDQCESYYDIVLQEGGTLLVPISRADSVGLRRLSSGVEAVTTGLCSPAESLPANFRERAAELRTRELLPQPAALVHSVRDVLAHSRVRTLSTAEKTWLDKSCRRLCTEAALVDGVPLFQARATILEVVARIGHSGGGSAGATVEGE